MLVRLGTAAAACAEVSNFRSLTDAAKNVAQFQAVKARLGCALWTQRAWQQFGQCQLQSTHHHSGFHGLTGYSWVSRGYGPISTNQHKARLSLKSLPSQIPLNSRRATRSWKSICLSTARTQIAFAVTENDPESIGGPAALSSPSPGLPRTRRA